MCLMCGGFSFFRMVYNGSMYVALGVSMHFAFKPLIFFINSFYVLIYHLLPNDIWHFVTCWAYIWFIRATSYSSLLCTDFVFQGWQKSVGRQISSFAIWGFSIGLCELQMCLAVCVGLITSTNNSSHYKLYYTVPNLHFIFNLNYDYRS